MEKVAENIVEDLLTQVLDWSLEDVNLQIGRADMVLSALGIKRLVLELKRPETLVVQRRAFEKALDQARRYADVQRVPAVAVSDGHVFFAADVGRGGLRARVLADLDAAEPPLSLWWVSVHGIYRDCPAVRVPDADAGAPPTAAETASAGALPLLHPKYHLPVACFAWVGSASDPHTWKLPYRDENGTPDTRRLPKAIQAILSNYRGARVDIPREAAADVLVRLAISAATLHKLPCQTAPLPTASAYQEAHDALAQLRRIADVGCCHGLEGVSS